MRRFAVSSWCLDGMLRSGMPLLNVPAQLKHHAIPVLEICHFHLPATDQAYLQALKAQIDESDIELHSILIDAGDIANPDAGKVAKDTAMIRQWIAIASALGAKRVRIDAGLQAPTDAVIRQSAAQLQELSEFATGKGVAASTENWHVTSQDPDALLAILDGCDAPLGLCADTGNAEATADKYATLAKLLPRATSIHFKARYSAHGVVDMGDVQRCTALINEHNFDGPITLIYDGKQDEWAGIERLRDALMPLIV